MCHDGSYIKSQIIKKTKMDFLPAANVHWYLFATGNHLLAGNDKKQQPSPFKALKLFRLEYIVRYLTMSIIKAFH